jgi:hypothetical protein
MKKLKLAQARKGKKMTNKLIGKPVIVRANVAGVHAGILESIDGTTVTLKDARRLWRYYTRDKTGSISDIAANGLKEKADHQIGAILSTVVIVNPNGLEIAEMSKSAWKSVKEF